MQLQVTFLVVAVLKSQHAVSALCLPQCSCNSPDGSWSPMYRMLTSPQPSENEIIPNVPPRCSCGCSPRRLPPRLSSSSTNTAQQHHAVSTLSGRMMGPATIIQAPPAMYVSSTDVQDSSQRTYDTSSHIMTIPRKQDSLVTYTPYETPSNSITTTDDASPSVTYYTASNDGPAVTSSPNPHAHTRTSFSTPQQMPCQPSPPNSAMFAPQPNFLASSPPRQIYRTQQAPLFASCPATLFYPATPPVTCAHPNFVYHANPSCSCAPDVPHSCNPFTYSNTDNNHVSNHDGTPFQDITFNTLQSDPSSSQTFTTGTFQNSPSNNVTLSTPDNQPKPTNSVTFNTNFQQTPSNSIYFNDSDGTGSSGTFSPKTADQTVTQDSPLTYRLLTSSTNNALAEDNMDCSVPVPPVLV